MSKNIIKRVVCHGLFVFLFCFSLAEGSDICYFNGLVQDPGRWETGEFNLLLEDETVPGYLIMTRVIGQIGVANISDLTSSSCKISKYVEALITYYNKNEDAIRKKHGEIAELLEFIKKELKNK